MARILAGHARSILTAIADEALVEAIEEARKVFRRGGAAAEVADQLGVSPQAVSSWAQRHKERVAARHTQPVQPPEGAA